MSSEDPSKRATEYLTAAYDIIYSHQYTQASDETAENAIALAQVIATISTAQMTSSKKEPK